MKKLLFKGLCVLTALSVIGVGYVVIDYCNNTITNSEYSSNETNDNSQNSFDSNKNEFAETKSTSLTK